LEQNDFRSNLIENIKENIRGLVDNMDFNQEIKIDDKMMLEVQRVTENIIRNPYQDWMYREKTRLEVILQKMPKGPEIALNNQQVKLQK
jgi:hypothetical protein